MNTQFSILAERRGKRTAATDIFATPPLKFMVFPAQDDGILRLMQMSSSPGLLSGDVINGRIVLRNNAETVLSTQSFMRVLSMNENESAVQTIEIIMDDYSRFIYLPHPSVLHKGASFIQKTKIELGNHNTLLYGEILSSGRTANGENYAFRQLSSQSEIYRNGRLLLFDNTFRQPEIIRPDVTGQMENFTHQLNLFYLCDDYSGSLKELTDKLYETLSQSVGEDCLWGISQTSSEIITLRALAYGAEDLQKLISVFAQVAVGKNVLSHCLL